MSFDMSSIDVMTVHVMCVHHYFIHFMSWAHVVCNGDLSSCARVMETCHHVHVQWGCVIMCARALYLRHRDCVQQSSRVTDTQKSVKTVWGDQIEWEDPAGTCICVITWRITETKIKTKRLQMFHKRLVLGLSVCKMYFARTWSPPTPPNSQK